MKIIIILIFVVAAIGGGAWILDANICEDGTIEGLCSFQNKPMFCYNHSLIENIDKCGCPLEEVEYNGNCTLMYETYPKSVVLPEVGIFLVYGGLNNYLDDIPDTISYYEYERPPSTEDFILKEIDNEVQNKYMEPLVEMIKNLTDDKNEQARIAIRMVQHIPYDDYEIAGRLPYEVIHDMTGVCGSKSNLLAYLLRELDFGVAVFEFEKENHRTIGVKCSSCDYENSGYCFIETTVPTIPTDSEIDFPGFGKLSSPSEIIIISDGYSLDLSKECEDANELDELDDKGKYLDKRDYDRWWELIERYDIETTG